MLELTSFNIQCFKNSLQIDVICIDLSKANVNLSLLVRKLNLLDFVVDLLNWIFSYPKKRTQRAVFKNSQSCVPCIPSQQGSHIGPLFLTVFINDIPLVVKH